jgi:hypothetical protein
MAKRIKRATARKAKPTKKGTPKKHVAKRLKTKAKRQKTSAKSGRSGAKKSSPRRPRTPTKQPQLEMIMVETPQLETTIVDVVEQPVPGVFVVTEFMETNAESEPADSLNIDQTIGPESEEQ